MKQLGSGICVCFILAACGDDSANIANAQLQDKRTNSIQSPRSAVRIRINLPLEAETSGITVPPNGTRITITAGITFFTPPYSPQGQVNKLNLHGKSIPLARRELKDGLFATEGFGEIELLVTGSQNGQGRYEYRAFPADIEKLKSVYHVTLNPENLKKLAESRARAEKGDAEAQCELGDAYFKGSLGVPSGDAEAVKWYWKAAQQGHAQAQFKLGLRYENGEGVPPSEAEAAKWYKQAAEQNYSYAQHMLVKCYAGGLGVGKDEIEAVKWCVLESKNNIVRKYSVVGLPDDLEKTCSSEQIAEGVKRAKTWLEQRSLPSSGLADLLELRKEMETRVREMRIRGSRQSTSVDAADRYGMTGLHRAARDGWGFLVKSSLDSGASINAKSVNEGYTPLHFAALNGQTEIVELLLARGAQTDIKDMRGRVPWELAAQEGEKSVVELLKHGKHSLSP